MMKNQLTLALLIAVLVSIIITGCSPSVGSTITLGHYNGKPIEWYIMADHNHFLTVVAMDVLEERSHTEDDENITWEQSTIRSWLNNEFFESAFTDEEKAKMRKHIVGSTPGNDFIEDYVFLLDSYDVKLNLPQYKSETDNMCTKIHCTGSWWLRSPGKDPGTFARVTSKGRIDEDGSNMSRKRGVRPALWLKY